MTYPDIPVQHLGSFAIGEQPDPLHNQFKDFDGVPVPLTGFTLTVEIQARPAALDIATGILTITSEAEGRVQYAWDDVDMAAVGFYRLQMKAVNGARKYVSDIFSYQVYQGPDTEEGP